MTDTANGREIEHSLPAMVPADPVTDGIRAWHDMKVQAMTAREESRVARQEADYLRGQNELLVAQKRDDTDLIRSLQSQVDEAKVHLNAFAMMVLQAVDRLGLTPKLPS